MWTDAQWRAFCLLMDRGFPGDFAEADREAWRVLLDDCAPAEAVAALKRLIAGGQKFRPGIGEFTEALYADPSRPSFAEAVQLIYGHPHGVLHAQPRGTYHTTDAQRRAMRDEEAIIRAESMHPLIAAFVRAAGVQHLREINLEDPDYGGARREQLRREWEDFCQRADHRQAAALTAGDSPRAGLTRFDPLAALGAGEQRQITEGGSE